MATTSKKVAVPCPICLDPFTSKIRKAIECPQCHEKTCLKCVEKYVLSTVEDPHCAHCRYAWSRSFLNTFCTQTFLSSTYYKHRQETLLNREKSYLPEMMVEAERIMELRRINAKISHTHKEENRVYHEYNELIKDIHIERFSLRTNAEINESKRRELKVKREYEMVREQFRIERQMLYRKASDLHRGFNDDAVEVKKEARKFIRRCPATDCKGFLSTAWKCGLCENWACPDCFEVKGKEKDVAHTCKPDMLETAKLIKKDAKPCPACGEFIMKIDGCDQMWCISCHTPFSWNTGEIVKSGPIHNPHYYQWLRKGGAAPTGQADGHIPCGGYPDAWLLDKTLELVPKEYVGKFFDIYRVCLHITDTVKQNYRIHHEIQNNRELGVMYLLKEIKEEDWKAALAKDEKDRQKSKEIRDILDAFDGAAIDIFRRIELNEHEPLDPIVAIPLIEEIVTELDALREYITGELKKVSKAFNCSVPIIDGKWEVTRGNINNIVRAEKAAEKAAVAREKADQMIAAALATAAAEAPARGGAGVPADE